MRLATFKKLSIDATRLASFNADMPTRCREASNTAYIAYPRGFCTPDITMLRSQQHRVFPYPGFSHSLITALRLTWPTNAQQATPTTRHTITSILAKLCPRSDSINPAYDYEHIGQLMLVQATPTTHQATPTRQHTITS